MKPGNEIMLGLADQSQRIGSMIDPDKNNVIMGGHFILSSTGENDSNLMGVFTRYSKLISEIVMGANYSNTKVFTMVNDWSILRSNSDSEKIRKQFWLDSVNSSFFNAKPEQIYSGFGTHGVINTPGLVSEKFLQNRFNKARRKAKGIENNDLLEIDRNSHSNPECATEVLMMLDLLSRDFDNFIGLMPSFCMDAIESAVKMFEDTNVRKELLNNEVDKFKITRVYYNSIAPNTFSSFLVGSQSISSNI
jgi:hypothetical protein